MNPYKSLSQASLNTRVLKILIVEDDTAITTAIAYTLEQEGFLTVTAHSVGEALPYLGTKDIDLFLLDVKLPDGTGYELCKKIKRFHEIPVIFLTACDEEANVVIGLDIGADDYIIKPFRVRELISRIYSVLRRYKIAEKEAPKTYSCSGIRILLSEGKVFRNGQEILLSALEYKLLLYLASHAGQIVSREQLLSHIFDITGEYVNDNTLTVYMKRLRDKLEDDAKNPTIIQTVRGLGYIMGE